MSTLFVRDAARGPWILLVPAIVIALVLALVGADSPASAATGQVTLTGRVTIANGATPAGAGEVAVHYTNLASNYAYRYSPYVLTDASGNFSITGDAGPYTLFFEYLGTASIASVYWGGPTRYDLTYISANADVSALNITLPPRAVVSGQVSLGAAGSHPAVPITYRVSVSQGSSYYWDGVTRAVSADGRFSVALDPGLYWLDFSAAGYQTRSWDGVSGSINENPTAVGVQDIGGVDPVLPALGSISGHVALGTASHAAAAGQVKITYSVPSVSTATSSVLTDANGDYVIPGLSDAQYFLLFEDVADHNFQSTSVSPVTVSQATPHPSSSVTLVTTGSISGQVLLGGSSRPAGAGEVQISFGGPASDGSLPLPIATTDVTGHYAITGLTAGNYTLFFHYSGPGAFADEYWSNTYSFADATPTTVSDSPVTRNVTLPASGSITGRLVNPKPAGEIAYVVARSSNVLGTADAEVQVTTNSDGTFTVPRLAPGTYNLWFYDQAFGPLATQSYLETPGTAGGRTVIVTAGTNQALGDIPLRRGTQVSGSVNCVGSCDFPGGTLATYELDGRDSPTSPWIQVHDDNANVDGYVSFAVAPGQYRITFRGPIGYSCGEVNSDPFVLTDGQALILPALTMTCGSGQPVHSQHDLDFTGDGLPDVLVTTGSGALFDYAGSGSSGWKGSALIGSGWNYMNAVVAAPGFAGAGVGAAVIARDGAGNLWLYRGDQNLWQPPVKIGVGWSPFTTIFSPGDFDGDGNSDVMAVDGSGNLWLYRGNGAGGFVGGAVRVGVGWNGFARVMSVGDFDGDGHVDIMAMTPSGALYLYRGNGSGGWLGSSAVGSGWNGFTAVFAPGDFSGDGNADVMARDSLGRLWLYPGNGHGGWLTPSIVGVGWSGLSFVS